MKHTKGIMALAMGVLLLGSLGCSFGHRIDFSREVFEKKEISFSLQQGDVFRIKADTDAIKLRPSEDGQMHIEYYQSEKRGYNFEQTEGLLTMTRYAPKFNIYFDGGLGKYKTVIYLPLEVYIDLELSNDTGSVDMEKISSLNALSIQVDTGAIHIRDAQITGDMSLSTKTGSIEGAKIQAGGSIHASTNTGSHQYRELTGRSIELLADTGSIEFTNLYADAIRIQADTGSVEGQLPGKQEDYTIHSDTDTGSNNLPESQVGGSKHLEAVTDTGSIRIRFSGK